VTRGNGLLSRQSCLLLFVWLEMICYSVKATKASQYVACGYWLHCLYTVMYTSGACPDCQQYFAGGSKVSAYSQDGKQQK